MIYRGRDLISQIHPAIYGIYYIYSVSLPPGILLLLASVPFLIFFFPFLFWPVSFFTRYPITALPQAYYYSLPWNLYSDFFSLLLPASKKSIHDVHEARLNIAGGSQGKQREMRNSVVEGPSGRHSKEFHLSGQHISVISCKAA